jgi:CRISPR-associated protein (TIGR03986 family)
LNDPSSKAYEEGRLRGRKFYWHQSLNAQNLAARASIENEIYSSSRKRPPGHPHTKQNITAHVLTTEAQFRFTVAFDNLTEWELGLLLWSLQLEPDHAHKLGYGRPLGLGSVCIRIGGVVIYDNAFRSLDGGEWVLGADEQTKYARRFLETAPDLRNLRRMLSWRAKPEAPDYFVSYCPQGTCADKIPSVLTPLKRQGNLDMISLPPLRSGRQPVIPR